MRGRAPRRGGLDAFGVADEGPGPRRGRRRLERVRALDSRNARHDRVSHVLSRRASHRGTSSERVRANSLRAVRIPYDERTVSHRAFARASHRAKSRFRASSKLSLAYLVVRRHGRRGDSYPRTGRPMCLGTAPTALGSAPVLGGTPRATRRALSPVRDAAARVTGGDE